MMTEALLIVIFALGLDFALGDPRSKFHPTAWVGGIIGRIIPYGRSNKPRTERAAGAIFVILVTSAAVLTLLVLDLGISLIGELVGVIVSILVGAILLKTTIAVRGMEQHAMAVVRSVKDGNMELARARLAMIVKRNTTDLDKSHVLSGVLESVSENTVDGITGPLFYFGTFGLFGAFVYRIVNTFDSMAGYKTHMFGNLGWFAANCDKILNYLPSRLTGLIMVLGAVILGNDWRQAYRIMVRDSSKLQSPNSGYPIAALAGALNTTLEKTNHYKVGDGDLELDISHVRSCIILMKVTSLLFCGMITIPTIVALSYLGWWLHA